MLVRPKHVCLMEMICGVVGQRYRDKTPTMYDVLGKAPDESFENGPAARALERSAILEGKRVGAAYRRSAGLCIPRNAQSRRGFEGGVFQLFAHDMSQ